MSSRETGSAFVEIVLVQAMAVEADARVGRISIQLT